MDFDYVRRNGFEIWQVIPLFFVTYIGMALLFGGSGQIAWNAYLEKEHDRREHDHDHHIHMHGIVLSWTLLIVGVCSLSAAILCGIVLCVIVPMIRKRRQRARAAPYTVRIPEPETGSVDGEVGLKTWFASSPSEVQESLHTLPHRYFARKQSVCFITDRINAVGNAIAYVRLQVCPSVCFHCIF